MARSSGLRTRFLLLETRAPDPCLERLPNLLRRDPGFGPEHKQMIEEIGAFLGEPRSVAAHALDHHLDRLLAELLRDLGCTLAEELRRIRRGGIAAATTGD